MASIYALADPRTGEVRYIGKANDPAARFKTHRRDSRRRNTPVYSWMRKLSAAGLAPGLVVLESDCADWRVTERRLIAEARARGDRLLNVADGGDEPQCPLETRQANGRKAASRRNEVVFWLLSQLGRNATYFRKRGDHARAEKMTASQQRLQGMSHEQQEDFEAKWKASGNYWPGQRAAGVAGSVAH